MDGNLLGEETSPYLLQHKDNPVAWRPWGDAAFADAKAQGKPILLSVGYAACHWCHVMAHESFEDPEVARVMNTLFVNIKVDREERPDVDSIYQNALALLGQQGGWPLTMFLTPEGEPFWGGTYFPPSSRYGRPGFVDVLTGVERTWRENPDKVESNVGALRDALDKLSAATAGTRIDPAEAETVARAMVKKVDPFHGGLDGAPKFPQPGLFHLLWLTWRKTRNPVYRTAVVNTLTQMSQGGIYDHLGGGYHRYSTDERWLVPHFEKMLYDNAQLLDLLTLVWQETRDPLFAERARQTVGWVAREMRAPAAPDGLAGFASTLDADSEGHEGKFYVWSEEEVDRVLGREAGLFKRVYDVSAEGNWEGTNILNRSEHLSPLSPADERLLAAARARLLAARAPRVRPGWDDKVLADWNGLMIAALAAAAPVFEEPGWLKMAREAFAFVVAHLTGTDGRLCHSFRLRRAQHPATLDDYANMMRAALALYEATGERDYLARARHWAGMLERHYADPAGGYFLTAADTGLLITRTKTAADHAVPSGNGTLVDVLARLHHLTGETAYRERAERIVAAFAGDLPRMGSSMPVLLAGNELLERPLQIVIAGDRGGPEAKALLRVVHDTSLPGRILEIVPPGIDLPAHHPASGKGAPPGHALAYICEGQTCSLPIDDPQALAADLDSR